MTDKFLYKTRFDVNLGFCLNLGEGFLSKASLDELAPLMQGVDFSQNIDLFGTAFNAAVVNAANKNDDGITSQQGIAIYKNFIHKPTNIEHDKTKVIGHIINAGFSRYGEDNELVDEEELANSEELFNLSLGSVVYRYVDPDFAALIERSTTEGDAFYHKISASWEVGFNAFDIAVGSDKFKDAEIITKASQIAELKKYLKAYGGNGRMEDGTRIYRVLKGEMFPLGIGYTKNPAAAVKGLISNESVEEKGTKPSSQATIISQINNINVKNKKETIMDAEKILNELRDLLIEKKFSEEAAANMTSTFAEAIKEKDKEYKESLLKEQKEKEVLAKEHETMKASVQQLQKDLEDSKQKIKEFEDKLAQEQAVAKFNSRMDAIDQEYVLDDQDRSIIVAELKSLDGTEESFASYQSKLAVIFRHKTKAAIDQQKKDLEAKIEEAAAKRLEQSNASANNGGDVDPNKALENATAKEDGVPNNNAAASSEPTFKEKFAAAFSEENITIQ